MSPNRTHIKYLDNIALKSFIKQNTFMSVCVLGSEFSVNTHDLKFVIKTKYILFNLCTYYTCTLFKLLMINKSNVNKQYNFLIPKHACFEYMF